MWPYGVKRLLYRDSYMQLCAQTSYDLPGVGRRSGESGNAHLNGTVLIPRSGRLEVNRPKVGTAKKGRKHIRNRVISEAEKNRVR